jgi:hypothetical protein
MPGPATTPHPLGQYRFLPGVEAFSAGVVAQPGHEIVHATLQAPVPYREGFALVDRHLREAGRPRAALCAMELRSPAPFTFDGFAEFNRGYRAILEEWGILVDGVNPIGRTNVAPVVGPPPTPSLHAFSYTVPSDAPGAPTFVVAGSGELREGGERGPAAIVRHGDTSADAMADKAAHVMATQQARLAALGGTWAQVTTVDVYTAHPIYPFLASGLLAAMGPAAGQGVHWYLSRPPIQGLEYEMDMRGVRRDIRIGR